MSQRHLEGYRKERGAAGCVGGDRLSMASRIDKVLRREVGAREGTRS